jgi:spermidine synthase
MKDSDNPDQRNTWLIDPVTDDLVQHHRVRKVLYEGRTDFQAVQVVDTCSYGICLVLDGKIQSGQRDEHVYHEALVHPAMLAHPDPKAIFIAGGGEGATLREVLQHQGVGQAVMVDLDRQVVDLCRSFLPSFNVGAFDDPRAELHFTDARKYLEKTRQRFDVAIIDIVDPLEAGPACLLYTKEFYGLVKSRLNPGGIMVIQSGSCGWTNLHIFTSIVRTLKEVYEIVRPYNVYVPSFVDLWGFTSASDTLDPHNLNSRKFNQLCRSRLERPLRSLDSISYAALFMLARGLRRKLASSHKVVTDASPVFI